MIINATIEEFKKLYPNNNISSYLKIFMLVNNGSKIFIVIFSDSKYPKIFSQDNNYSKSLLDKEIIDIIDRYYCKDIIKNNNCKFIETNSINNIKKYKLIFKLIIIFYFIIIILCILFVLFFL